MPQQAPPGPPELPLSSASEPSRSRPRRIASAAAGLRSALGPPRRERPRDYFERLREHEELLRGHWPKGGPSGEPDGHFDDALARRRRKLDRQLLTETVDDVSSILLKWVWLAVGATVLWDRFLS
jgi:hypothetical protein